MIPQHLSISGEHRTPKYLVEAARKVLGQIDLDPASCEEANEVVQAISYFAPPHDGLTFDWDGRILLNPPGGSFVLTKKMRAKMRPAEAKELAEKFAAEAKRWQTKSRAVAWWRKLVEEYGVGHCREAIFIGFSLDILQAAQGCDKLWPDVLKFPICVPKKRIKFLAGKKVGKMPTHGNVIVYLPSRPSDARKFERVFRTIGSTMLPVLSQSVRQVRISERRTNGRPH